MSTHATELPRTVRHDELELGDGRAAVSHGAVPHSCGAGLRDQVGQGGPSTRAEQPMVRHEREVREDRDGAQQRVGGCTRLDRKPRKHTHTHTQGCCYPSSTTAVNGDALTRLRAHQRNRGGSETHLLRTTRTLATPFQAAAAQGRLRGVPQRYPRHSPLGCTRRQPLQQREHTQTGRHRNQHHMRVGVI